MKVKCLICNKDFIIDEEDMERIANTVDRHNLGTTAILDMLTPLMGICNSETEDYHVIDFDPTELEELHRLGVEHKDVIKNMCNSINAQKKIQDETKILRKKLKDLIDINEIELGQSKYYDMVIQNALDKCETITFSRRLELWQVEDEQQSVQVPSNEISLQNKNDQNKEEKI